jgi:hypothetical protein
MAGGFVRGSFGRARVSRAMHLQRGFLKDDGIYFWLLAFVFCLRLFFRLLAFGLWLVF